MFSVSLLRPSVRTVRVLPAIYRDFWDPLSLVSVRRPATARDEFDEFARSLDESFRGLLAHVHDPKGKVALDPTKYQMRIAVGDFKPDDIKVKVQGQNLIVEAKQEVKEESGGLFSYSLREIRRSFTIAENVDKQSLRSTLSNEGILEVEAQILQAVEEKQLDEKREIEVTHMEEDDLEQTTAKETE